MFRGLTFLGHSVYADGVTTSERVVGKSSELLDRSDDEGVRITEVCACGCNDATSRYRYCSSLLT